MKRSERIWAARQTTQPAPVDDVWPDQFTRAWRATLAAIYADQDDATYSGFRLLARLLADRGRDRWLRRMLSEVERLHIFGWQAEHAFGTLLQMACDGCEASDLAAKLDGYAEQGIRPHGDDLLDWFLTCPEGLPWRAEEKPHEVFDEYRAIRRPCCRQAVVVDDALRGTRPDLDGANGPDLIRRWEYLATAPEGRFAEYELPKQATYVSYVREAWSDMGRTKRQSKATRPEASKTIVGQEEYAPAGKDGHSPNESRSVLPKSRDAVALERWEKIQTYAADLAVDPERRDSILPKVRGVLEKLDVSPADIDAALADETGQKLGELAEKGLLIYRR